jgi:CubicO group peptidase (beta-lactamase class C family)
MSENSEKQFEQLSEFVTQVMEKTKVPGVALGVLYDDETYTASFGVTNVDHPLDVTPDTLFQIGSITKTFTATAIMRLVEQGELNLDATVQTYVPDFKVADEDASSKATVWHLLTHTSGWVGDFFADTGAGDDAIAKYVAKMADLEQLAPVGSLFSYNNAGFCLAGYIIEAVTGKRYEAALRELILEPLGLENVYFNPGDVITHRFAVGHEVADEGAKVLRPWPLPRSAYAAGGITCPVEDLLRYARFHMGNVASEDETPLLTAESLAMMQTGQVTIRKDHEVGLSWFIDDVDGVKQISHGGGTMGQISLLAIVPEHGFALAVFTNADEGGEVTDQVRRRALKTYLGLEVETPKPLDDVAEEDLRPYVGRYARPFAEMELGILAGRLVGQVIYKKGFPHEDSPPPPSPPPSVLTLCEEDRLIVTDGPSKDMVVDVVRKPDGAIGWLRMGRLYKRLDD